MHKTSHSNHRFTLKKTELKHQQGISLVMVLIFMLILSGLAAFGVRNVTLLEKQAHNELEYQVARQAAEAALRDAELDLRIPEPKGLFTLTGAKCGRESSLLRSKGIASATDSAEFTDSCLEGQCGISSTRYAVQWDDAKPTNKGTPWWPTSKGGDWGNNVNADGSPDYTCGSSTGGVPLGTYTGTPAVVGVARQPEYLIEVMTPETSGAAAVESTFECQSRSSSGSVTKSAANEVIGSNSNAKGKCYLFRITARGFGASLQDNDIDGKPNPKVEVLLQSYFQLFVK
jgi:type IV pilus assembly protein PilX